MERLGCEEDFQEWMVRGDCRVVAFDAERPCPFIPGSDALKDCQCLFDVTLCHC